jgi:hypothetical protein
MMQWWNDTDRAEQKCAEQNRTKFHFLAKIHTKYQSGIEPSQSALVRARPYRSINTFQYGSLISLSLSLPPPPREKLNSDHSVQLKNGLKTITFTAKI